MKRPICLAATVVLALGVSEPLHAREGVALIVPDFHQFAIDGNLDGWFDHFEQWGLPGDLVMTGEPYSPYRNGRSELIVMRTRRDWGPGVYVKSQDGRRRFSGRYVRKSWLPVSDRYRSLGFVADFNGDGLQEMCSIRVYSSGNANVYIDRDANLSWYKRRDTRVYLPGLAIGARDRVFAGRVGDNKDEMLVWCDSTGNWDFYVTDRSRPTNHRFLTIQFGLPGDIPILGDANGDGVDDLMVFRPSNNVLYINYYERRDRNQGYGRGGDVDRVVDYGPAISLVNQWRGLRPNRRWDLGGTNIRW